MSDLCRQYCFAYALCVERGAEDPTEYNRSFRQMIGTKGLHTEEQIMAAQELSSEADICHSTSPQSIETCRIIAAAILKNVIG